ncbi:uncharacterized protein LOC123716109 [Pieris brassicae]|uniref:NADH dehydrogenase [ubiquinone] 1 alpha subcomplex subunit 11 n=1 Tax=Pieris brassicae TaxID=7116 RepID=A0A9P0TGX2_PIEBR|nr:uncharacterized protein LOC123716109 [Pieris brassicae]CAH4029046.1 unnamed protein product [Pieris brassicae]
MSCDCNTQGKTPQSQKALLKAQATKNYYSYYDTPDGCDVPKKILAASRLGAIVGVLIATKDILLYSHAVSVGPIIKRYIYHAGPLMAMGATFAAVSNGMLQFRQEDDHLNYFAGGFACGPILAAYLRNYHAILLGGLILGTMGAIKKEALIHNVPLFPSPPGHMRTIRDWRNNYNILYKDPLEEMKKTCNVHNKEKK